MKLFDIAIAGELNLDLIFYGLPAEMPLERELLADRFRATLGSSSAIVAANAALLGARVAFTTMVGPDDFGRLALEQLALAGVDISRTIRHDTIATGLTVLLPHGDQRHILTYPGTIAELTVGDLDFKFLAQARHFHLSSLYLQRGLHAELPYLLKSLKGAGLTISLDTNDDPENRWGAPLPEILPYIDVILPNEDEICRMTSCVNLDAAIRSLAAKVPVIVVKRGRHGVRVHERGLSIDIAPLSVVPVDTIGAGDSFDAGFLRSYLLSKDVLTCARAGNITGALSTQSSGGTDAFRNHAKRDNFLTQHQFVKLIA